MANELDWPQPRKVGRTVFTHGLLILPTEVIQELDRVSKMANYLQGGMLEARHVKRAEVLYVHM